MLTKLPHPGGDAHFPGREGKWGGPQVMTTWQVPLLKAQAPGNHFYTVSGSASKSLARTCPPSPAHLLGQGLWFLEDKDPLPQHH